MFISHYIPGYTQPPTFSPGFEVRSAERTLYVSGQLGISSDGKSAEGIEAQAEIIMENILNLARSVDMTAANIVKLTAYLTDPADYPAFVAVRGRYLGDVKPASTLVFVSQLARPELLAEVEAVLCK